VSQTSRSRHARRDVLEIFENGWLHSDALNTCARRLIQPFQLEPSCCIKGSVAMPKETWIAANVLAIAALIGLVCFFSSQHGHQIDKTQAELDETRASLSKAQSEAETLKKQFEAAQTQVEDLKKEQDAAMQMHKGLEDEMRAALESKDVTISELQGKLTVNILDRVLFDSGEAELKPDGAAVLKKVAAILAQHPKATIHVVGHTDNVPIRASARSRFASNWELSTARATAAVRFLTETCGLDPRRLGAVGYGEFRPVADNSTAEGRARNRRIAITIASEELAGADISSGIAKRISNRSPATNSVPRTDPTVNAPNGPAQD
jgi:flagellar motor protein MotB